MTTQRFRRSPTATRWRRLRFVISLVSITGTPAAGLAAEPLAAVVVDGCTVYGAADIYDVYGTRLGQPVAAATAAAIASTMQQKYVDDGYSRPGYAVLDAGLDTGIVRIRLVEARITEVRITGDSGPWRESLESIVGELENERLLRPEAVRDALRRARRLPGLTFSAATESGAEQGAYVLALESDYRPLEGAVTLSNRGTREIGRTLLNAKAVSNAVLGANTSAGLFFSTAKDSDDYLGGGLFTSTAFQETEATLQFQAATTSLGIEVNGTPVRQGRERMLLRYSQPVRATGDTEILLHAGADAENLEVRQDGVGSQTERLRSLEAGLLVDHRSGNGGRQFSADIEKGLRGFGARIDPLVPAGDSPVADFTIVELRYVHVRRLDAFTLRWDAVAQYSPHVLPSIKRFKVGGGRIGRGFEAAAASGDRGIGNKLELRRPVPVSWLERAALYAYFDLGTAWRNAMPDRESASSTGFGVAWGTASLSGYVELAQPLTHADADGQDDATVFAEIGWRF